MVELELEMKFLGGVGWMMERKREAERKGERSEENCQGD